MKTKAIFVAAIALSVALLSCQKENIVPASADNGTVKTAVDNSVSPSPAETKVVRYIVNVHLSGDKPLCGAYQVEVLNGAGVLVAPPRPFIPGVSSYIFTEQTRLDHGIRMARLESATVPDGFECKNPLYTPPDILWVKFENEASFTFDLYPQTNPPKPS
jgi:hypothetical protein